MTLTSFPQAAHIYPTTSYGMPTRWCSRPPAPHLRRLLAQGWTDAIWAANLDETIFTFWDYRRNRWSRDAGLRLDHLLLSPDLAGRLAAAGVDREVRGRENASDHAPVWIELTT